ncbi:metal-sulfur cluster biosynthetic enzyme [Pseudonocardia sp. EC080610-09]|uniref:iron-sulfur cluster assembly protein n=1 Tax=unclassified Pseudonocardia TaxID=2619320 RepID=UPI000706A934|nr:MULTISPECIES: iron-sulfur cluster assembly protein [unclassified Pseudonocardia]ALL75197.1 metal-sulfur cluster biosynthetic enzyme [Pseudonocardia sp. EC080610-09]ALL82222.1 metal-sulfur cluster biosynthetic enzyme [Pseudonocardia sp. EC080619-01]
MSAPALTRPGTRRDEAWHALDAVVDPELDEPITDLEFVRSLEVDGDRVVVHLRLPTAFCAPNFAYLMCSDAKDVLTDLDWTGEVVVELDDHHDSDLINAGLAADAGYRGTFRHEADSDLDELRATFQRKAHAAAMERSLTGLLRADPDRTPESLFGVTLGDLPDGPVTEVLLRRRATVGLGTDPALPVLVGHDGVPYPAEQVPLKLRMARSQRISIEGNAHFCRGLLRTRYPESTAPKEYET